MSVHKSTLLLRLTSCRKLPKLYSPLKPKLYGSTPTILSLGENMTTLRFMSAAPMAKKQSNPMSTTSAEPGSLEALLHSINLFAQRSGRILDYDARRLLNKLYMDTNAITPNHALFAIRCLGSINVDLTKNERQKLLDEFFAKCQEVKLRMDISHHNAILKAYLENDHQFSPTAFLAEIANAGLQPNR